MIESKKVELQVKRKRSSNSDRLRLSSQLQSKSDQWVDQVNRHFNGMLVLKKNEVIHFLLEDLPETLPVSLLDKMQKEKLTDIQKAKWIYEQLKDAEVKGKDLPLDTLLQMAKGKAPKKENKSRKVSSNSPAKTSPVTSLIPNEKTMISE